MKVVHLTTAISVCMWLELVKVLLWAGNGHATPAGHSWWRMYPAEHFQVVGVPVRVREL